MLNFLKDIRKTRKNADEAAAQRIRIRFRNKNRATVGYIAGAIVDASGEFLVALVMKRRGHESAASLMATHAAINVLISFPAMVRTIKDLRRW